MTTITFKPDPANQLLNWDDPARWTGGVVPNDPAVDVVIPTTTTAGGDVYLSFITETGIRAAGSLTESNNFLLVQGTLAVTHNVDLGVGANILLQGGGHLSAESIDNGHAIGAGNAPSISGSGTVTVTGQFINETRALVGGTSLSLTASSLTNLGVFETGGDFTVTVTPGGFTNLSSTTLSGGSYRAGNDIDTNGPLNMHLNVGSIIATDAADISLGFGGHIYSFDDAGHVYVALESSLHSIAGSGKLTLTGDTFVWSDLTVDGLVKLAASTLNTTHITVDSGGIVSGYGTLGGPTVNDGTIAVGLQDTDDGTPANLMLLTGPVSGSGTAEIRSALIHPTSGHLNINSATLEIGAAFSNAVVFDDGHGILTLDDHAEFFGTIKPAAAGDEVIVSNTSFDSVTGYSYSGDSHAGTLAIQTTGGEIDLQFLGNFTTANFSLAAGPQHLSSDPESLLITNTGSAPTVLAPIAEDSGARLITQAELLSGFVGASPVASSLAIAGGNGTLVDNHNGTWSYTAAHNDDSAVSFSYTVTYNGGPVAESATLDITPVNDAPVNTVPGALSTTSDTDFAIAGLSVSDVDATSLTTTLHVDHGTLAVAAVGGATVGGSGTATVTLTGSVAQIDAALGAANNVLYHSTFDFSGLDHLTITSNDGGSTGAGGALADTDLVNIQVAENIQELAAPPHLALGGSGATSATSMNVPGPSGSASAGVADFTFAAADVGHSPDVNSPGILPHLSDFHLI